MKTYLRSAFFALLLTAGSPSAGAADGPTTKPAPPTAASQVPALTVRDALALAVALRNLDGRLVIVPADGGKPGGSVMVPWEFGSGSLRLRIANDLAIVSAVEKNAEDVRQGIVRELLRKYGVAEIRPATPEFEEFRRQYDQLLDQPAAGARDLGRIKASELRLDRNEIPVTALQALKPILDQD